MTVEHLSAPTPDIYRATVAAALASRPLLGAGDKNAVDGLAVDAMRRSLLGAGFGGVVVIGEGEKDEAPMLFTGEVVGDAAKVEWDIAVDPIDGTALAAAGVPGAVSVMAAAVRGGMMAAPEIYYMQKIVSGPVGRGLLDLDFEPERNIELLAEALGKPVLELNVTVIDKGRNQELIRRIRATGANWVPFAEGDVAMAVAAATPGSGIDMLLGIGGNPEGVVTACAVQALGGFMQGRLMPLTQVEMDGALAAGYDLTRKFELSELASGERFVFVLTALTDGPLARGMREADGDVFVETYVLDSELDAPQVIGEWFEA